MKIIRVDNLSNQYDVAADPIVVTSLLDAGTGKKVVK